MDANVRFKFYICVLLVSVFEICVSDNLKTTFPKICHTLAPVKLDTWWMVYARDSANHRGTQKVEEAGDVSLHMNRSSNDSAVKFAETDGNGSRVDGDVDSDFEWKVARKMSDEVVTGRVPPDKRTAHSGEANDEEAAEERKVERRKDAISVGEYCCSAVCADT
jgi:hypothetical protein